MAKLVYALGTNPSSVEKFFGMTLEELERALYPVTEAFGDVIIAKKSDSCDFASNVDAGRSLYFNVGKRAAQINRVYNSNNSKGQGKFSVLLHSVASLVNKSSLKVTRIQNQKSHRASFYAQSRMGLISKSQGSIESTVRSNFKAISHLLKAEGKSEISTFLDSVFKSKNPENLWKLVDVENPVLLKPSSRDKFLLNVKGQMPRGKRMTYGLLLTYDVKVSGFYDLDPKSNSFKRMNQYFGSKGLPPIGGIRMDRRDPLGGRDIRR